MGCSTHCGAGSAVRNYSEVIKARQLGQFGYALVDYCSYTDCLLFCRLSIWVAGETKGFWGCYA